MRVQKVMFSWGLGKTLERVALEWSRSRLMSRWRSRKVRCKLRLWKGKEGSPHGLGWDRKALGSLSMVWLFVLRMRDLINGKESGGKWDDLLFGVRSKLRGVFSSIRGCGPGK